MADRDDVRLLATDLGTGDEQLLTDAQIDTCLRINGQNVRRAAAEALEIIARSEVLVSKKIRTQDLATDGPAVAAELRASAAQLRAMADDDEDTEFAFEIVDTGSDRPELTEREQWWS
jgi:hypothetical protein